MANRKKRIPKPGDRVVTLWHKGAFVISSVDGDLCIAELKPQDAVSPSVPFRGAH
jgi:hypothetical protein